jgi:signal transduction histidine kinase
MRLMAWMLGDLPQDAELQKELRIQQAIMLVRQLPILFIANPVCSALMVVAFWTKADQLFLLGWMVATFAFWSLPVASWLRLRHRPRPEAVSPRKERHAAVFSIIAGCLWAVALVVLFPLATPDEQTLISLEICGLMAGALACLPSSPRSCLGYAMPMYSAGVTQWLPLDQSPLHALSFIVAAFGPAVVVFVYNNWRAFVANVKIIVERARLFDQQAEEIARRRKAEAELQASLAQLRATQSQLLVQEKMASLGQLTAGIAHEIKNPLNFVNNFAELSTELLDELDDVLGRQASPERDAEAASLVHMLSGNMQKIADHGRRGDSIIKSMLLHSRGGSGEWRATNLNALLEESLNLAYHGARARDQDFNI